MSRRRRAKWRSSRRGRTATRRGSTLCCACAATRETRAPLTAVLHVKLVIIRHENEVRHNTREERDDSKAADGADGALVGVALKEEREVAALDREAPQAKWEIRVPGREGERIKEVETPYDWVSVRGQATSEGAGDGGPRRSEPSVELAEGIRSVEVEGGASSHWGGGRRSSAAATGRDIGERRAIERRRWRRRGRRRRRSSSARKQRQCELARLPDAAQNGCGRRRS